MNWHVYITAKPGAAGNIGGPRMPLNLGTGEHVRARLTELLPSLEFSSDGWGDYDSDDLTISAPVTEADHAPVTTISLFLYGNSGSAALTALRIAEAFNAQVYATWLKEFLTADTAHEAFDSWHAFQKTQRADG
ncbi:hypothetical protein [Streptomyces sp. S.PB5]|uniref:hypothetical protein n=1 Tax=Streptomyces sp. S.PB5 TaxID=3020844 RepID=UPI0025B016EA|nr:hypothetical protein [Streptomyces sp. S.PB5]MDN3027036.1 hypothetical protein [Streptomyces sp. S.PB5]